MLRELQKRMEEFHMVSSGDRVLAGVSGGADSVCLLLVLLELQKAIDFSLEVIHVEHGIRGAESVSDARFVEELCKKHAVFYQGYEVDVPAFAKEHGLGYEEAARIMRYEIFEKLALEKGAKVALAHHKEDNAETVLFQMTRGSSLAGLCGMQPVRVDEKGVCYIRPLLFLHREEIEEFLKEREVTWCVDSTNAELEYSRNFLRVKVVPELKQINAQVVEHINQAASHLSEIKDYLDVETERVWTQIATVDENLTLDVRILLDLHVVLQRQVAYKAIVLIAERKKDITSAHVEDLLALCKGQSGKRISLPYGITAWKEFDAVHLDVADEKNRNSEYEAAVYEISKDMLDTLWKRKDEQGNVLALPIGDAGEIITCRIFENKEETLEIPRKTYTKWLDYDKIKQGICIRTRRSGDYFISDALGHRKKLKTYFIDEKIPLAERDKRLLLAKESEVLWLIGGRISEHIKVSQKTKYILEITYDGGNKNE